MSDDRDWQELLAMVGDSLDGAVDVGASIENRVADLTRAVQLLTGIVGVLAAEGLPAKPDPDIGMA